MHPSADPENQSTPAAPPSRWGRSRPPIQSFTQTPLTTGANGRDTAPQSTGPYEDVLPHRQNSRPDSTPATKTDTSTPYSRDTTRKGQGRGSRYIQRRTQQALSRSTPATARYQANPFHHGAAQPRPPPIPPATPLTEAPRLSSLNGSQGSTSQPTQYQWATTDLTTPLNKMPRGTSTHWTYTGGHITARLHSPAQPFAQTTNSSLTAIPESAQLMDGDTPTGAIPLGPGPPTPDMVTLGNKLRTIPTSRLLIDDFMIPRSSMGISVMVAMLLERVRPNYTLPQCHNIAHILLTTHPETLLELYQHPEALQQFARDEGNRTDILPPFVEKDLSPCLVPRAVRDTDLRIRVIRNTLTRHDNATLIHAFVRCFYPAHLARAKKVLREATTSTADLAAVATTPGYFRSFWENTGRTCVYDPPCWIDLTLPPVGHSILPQPTDSDGMESDTGTEVGTCLLDGFTPSQHIGLLPNELDQMSVGDIRSRAILMLPPLLKQLTTPSEAADIIIALASTPEADFRKVLTTAGFGKCLATIRTPEKTPLVPPPLTQYRIRLHLEKENDWTGLGEAALTWIYAVKDLMIHLGHSFKLLRAPYESPNDHNILNSHLDIMTMESYAYPRSSRNEVGTFDMWCATSCEGLGTSSDAFPHTGPEVDLYYSTLHKAEIVCECQESWPYGMVICAAFVGSDRRDPSERALEEYRSRLQYRIDDNLGIPPFQIAWCSLWLNYRPVMVKCAMCHPEHVDTVLEMFTALQQSTASSFHQVTHIYSIHLIPQDPALRTQAITEAAQAQKSFTDGCTKVTLSGTGGVDPFTFVPCNRHPDGSPCDYTLAEQILHGTVHGVQGDNPIMKITADSSFNRYHLIAHYDDALTLLKYSRAFVPVIARWFGKRTDEFSLDISEARAHVKHTTPTIVSTQSTADYQTTGLPSDIMSTLLSIQQSVRDQGAEIKAIKLGLNNPVGKVLSNDVASVVQSSITGATEKWKELLEALHSRHAEDLISLLESIVGDLRSLNHKIGVRHEQAVSTFSELVQQYDSTITDTNENTKAYGNELAMMRIHLEALADRLNWIVEDLGLQARKPRLPPAAMDMVITEVYRDYYAGKDMAHAKDTSDTQDDTLLQGEQSEDDNTNDMDPCISDRQTPIVTSVPRRDMGRPGTPPPLHPPQPPQGPLQSTQTPPLPLSPTRDITAVTDAPSPLEPTRRDDLPQGPTPSTTTASNPLSCGSEHESNQSTSLTLALMPPDQAHMECIHCETQITTPSECDICHRTVCLKCLEVDIDQGFLRCTLCRPSLTQDPSPDTLNTQPNVDSPPSDACSHTSTSSSSDETEGSSFSQRSVNPNIKRRRLRKLKDKPKSDGSTTATTVTTQSTYRSRSTRRSVQPSIDAMLRPRGTRVTSSAPRTRASTNSHKHA